MMNSPLVLSLAFVLATLSGISEAKVAESLELRIYDPDQKLPKGQMLALLKNADLEGHGFRKEVGKKLAPPGTDQNVFQITHFYYKAVNCSRIGEVEQEIDTLMPGTFQGDLNAKFDQEIKIRKLTTMRNCQVGLEVHFQEGCTRCKNSVRRQRRHHDHSPTGSVHCPCCCCKCCHCCKVGKGKMIQS